MTARSPKCISSWSPLPLSSATSPSVDSRCSGGRPPELVQSLADAAVSVRSASGGWSAFGLGSVQPERSAAQSRAPRPRTYGPTRGVTGIQSPEQRPHELWDSAHDRIPLEHGEAGRGGFRLAAWLPSRKRARRAPPHPPRAVRRAPKPGLKPPPSGRPGEPGNDSHSAYDALAGILGAAVRHGRRRWR